MPSSTARIAVVAVVAIIAITAPVQASAGLLSKGEPSTFVRPGTQVETNSTVASGKLKLTAYSGPRVDWSTLNSKQALWNTIASGQLERTDEVAVTDPLVLTVRHEGLAESLSRGNATRRFFAYISRNDTGLSIEQTNPTPERHPKTIELTRNGTSVVADPVNETTYIVVDTRNIGVYYGKPSDADPDDRTQLRRDENFAANLTIESGSNLTTGDRAIAAETSFSIRVREASVDVADERTDRNYVYPAPDQRISGQTNVRAGQNVTVVVRWNDDQGSITDKSGVIRQTAPVQLAESGEEDSERRFGATFDFSGVSQNATASIDVRFDGQTLVHSNATLVVTALEADIGVREIRPNASNPYGLVETTANLSRGGFVVLHRGNSTGEIVGVSQYLAKGSHRNVSVYVGYPVSKSGQLVAVAHRDANHNHWFDEPTIDRPYATNGSAMARTDYVLTPQEPVQVTPTTAASSPPKSTNSTQSKSATPTAQSTTPKTETNPGNESSTSQPGFGGFEVLLAFSALLLGLLLKRQRRH